VWESILSLLIVHGFTKCHISNSIDVKEDDILWEDASDGDNSSNVKEESGDDCLFNSGC
jgi:hypothetical protein